MTPPATFLPESRRRLPPLVKLVVGLTLLLVLSSCGGGADGGAGTAAGDESAGGESASNTATEQLSGEFATVAGGQIDLASLQGQDTVLWFWAPW